MRLVIEAYSLLKKSTDFYDLYFYKVKMDNREAKEILELIELINEEEQKCCLETLQLLETFEKKYNELLPKMPYNINVIDELHINENGHSRILTKLLQFKNPDGKYEILESLLKYIVEEMHCENFRKIKINNPKITQEKCRIDLWIRDSKYALIFENKACDACDQEAQIHRYIEKTLQENYTEDQIFVIYLPSDEKEPSYQSWGKYKEAFKERFVNLSFRNCIIPWLKNYVKPNVRQRDQLLLSAITQYIDYLEGIFSLRTINNKVNMELQELISENIFKGCEATEEKLKVLESKRADIDKLSKQINLMTDKFASIWLNDLSRKYQAEFDGEWVIKKNVGDLTVVLGIDNQKPWWGVSCESEYTDYLRNAVEKKIVSAIDIDKKNISKNSNNYLVWSWTSYKNGESRFCKLVNVLSEYKIEQ